MNCIIWNLIIRREVYFWARDTTWWKRKRCERQFQILHTCVGSPCDGNGRTHLFKLQLQCRPIFQSARSPWKVFDSFCWNYNRREGFVFVERVLNKKWGLMNWEFGLIVFIWIFEIAVLHGSGSTLLKGEPSSQMNFHVLNRILSANQLNSCTFIFSHLFFIWLLVAWTCFSNHRHRVFLGWCLLHGVDHTR